MRRNELAARVEEMRRARTPYVLATVVRAQRPTSAKPGDSAVILADGSLDGFVGGTCAESTVRLTGMRLLTTGASTLLRITPDEAPSDDEDGLLIVNNPCLSGGSLEIFMEAMLPNPLLYVYGDAPVARALGRIGSAAGYDIVPAGGSGSVALEPIPPDTAAVIVASHGHGEEAVLAAALRADVPYIALVASRARGDVVLASIGTDRERVHSPAGLDIGARTAPDVALSILAEVVATRIAATPPAPAPTVLPAPATGVAVDPVCGMDVTISATALQAEHAGTTYYFCGSGCKVAFVDDPHRYLTAHAAAHD